MGKASSIGAIVATLRAKYGDATASVTDPFDMILLENAAYLVDDARRLETFGKLRAQVGLTPQAILAHSAEEIAAAIAGGGMRPPMRAEKVRDCARIASDQNIGTLRKMVKDDSAAAKKMLREYPGVGEPYADKILLFNGAGSDLAPDSNALRVLLRLGFGVEHKSYSTSYKSAMAATRGAFPKSADAIQAHLVLRRHGQELCKRTAPRCDRCPVRAVCVFVAQPVRRR